MPEIICVDGHFKRLDLDYMEKYGIKPPIESKLYTIREVVQNTIGGPGLLLVELVNPPSPKISPSTGVTGMAEQNWGVWRFRTLAGDLISKEVLAEVKWMSFEESERWRKFKRGE